MNKRIAGICKSNTPKVPFKPKERVRRPMGIPNPLLDLMEKTPRYMTLKEKMSDPWFMQDFGERLVKSRGFEQEKDEVLAMGDAFLSLNKNVEKVKLASTYKKITRKTAVDIHNAISGLSLVVLDAEDKYSPADHETSAQLLRHLWNELYETGVLLKLFNSGLSDRKITKEELESMVYSNPHYFFDIIKITLEHCSHKKFWLEIRLIGLAAGELSELNKLLKLTPEEIRLLATSEPGEKLCDLYRSLIGKQEPPAKVLSVIK